MPFEPGQSGNPHGRPRGSRNKSGLAVREWATGIVEDPQVQARLLADARAGKLHPTVLMVLMTYAYGRPNPRDVPEPETPITIELNIPKPPVYRLRVLGQWFDGIRFYAAASSPRRSRRTWAGLR